MAQTKTKATAHSVADFLAGVDNPVRRADAGQIIALLERISGAPATMWGPTIIGFGKYHYRYESGHEGDMCRIGFSPRKPHTVLYVLPDFDGKDALLARLGKHKTGKSCLYVNRLADIDMTVLEEIAQTAWDYMARTYPD
jgi:hypothetical protein